ncbi:hypothetical protein HOP50_04g33340 [Chloropicon primus]|uniref:Uncharacterized protein n=1 Tax=Chloropicon primus TaxID=1764295 RepID=A0A5B8MK31_9CHLO|nr:hypothetical protein A3770_04p33310 [Chloropicon primus]UPR00025.1 hypothetical protein HOP50_04g33340 [Chloropicon primus]|eukprot:QDZ20813.1 hypothetical protein A3770_04p33310 [Chloropicon primus]
MASPRRPHLLLLLLLLVAPSCLLPLASAFDIASPVFGAIGSVAAYSINKLVIDPERERQVFKVWKELRDAEEEEARFERRGGAAGASAQSILPEYVRGSSSRTSDRQQDHHRRPPDPPEPIVDPVLRVSREACNATGILTLILEGFTPSGRVQILRSPRPAYDSGSRERTDYDPSHFCGGTQLMLEAGSTKHFMTTQADQRGRALMEVTLRDRRACDYFAYQCLDVPTCATSNTVVLAKTTPLVLASALETLETTNPYGYARELDLP